MKILEKIKIVLERGLNNTFKVTNVETLLKQKEKMTKVLMEAKDGLNKIKGKNKQKDEEIKTKMSNLEKLLNISKQYKQMLKSQEGSYIKQNKECEDCLKEAYFLYEEENEKIKMLKKQKEINDKLIKDTENKVSIYEQKIKKIDKNIDILKTKAEYAENVKEFKKITRDLNIDGDIKDISKKIDEDFYTAEFDLKDIEKETKDTEDFIEAKLNETNYQNFLSMLDE